MGLGDLFDRTIAASMPLVPKAVVRKVAARYVAGETLDDAEATVRRLMEMGACATLDVLGEEIHDLSEGEATTEEYLEALDRIAEQKLDCNVSIKLTAFGLQLDPEVTYERVRRVVEKARDLDNFVRIDMEDSSVTTATLELFRRLREEGFDNVGVVIQAYLKRSAQDLRDLAELTPSYRLCKGIYVEPEEIAIKDGLEINRNYVALLKQMAEGGSRVGIATHDHRLVDASEELISSGVVSDYEFQMLLGVDEPLARKLVREKHQLRIYVPYGKDWYAYCVRRLKENPRIGRHVFFGLFKRH